MAVAGERVDKTLAAPPDAMVVIRNTRGDVEVSGQDANEVSVSGELDDLAEELVFTVEGRDILIDVRMPRKDVNWGDGSDLHIRVPRGSKVRFEGVSTDVRVENIEGGAQLRTVSGDIEAHGVNNQLIVNSVSGDVVVTDADGRTQVSTISGDLELTLSGKEIKVDSVSGDIEAELGGFERLTAETVSGEIEIAGELMHAGTADLSSVSGDVGLKLAQPVNAELNVRSGIGADIYNSWNNVEPRTLFPSQQELRTTSGDGSGRINIRTVSSDIRLD